jgi:hypothetical protein
METTYTVCKFIITQPPKIQIIAVCVSQQQAIDKVVDSVHYTNEDIGYNPLPSFLIDRAERLDSDISDLTREIQLQRPDPNLINFEVKHGINEDRAFEHALTRDKVELVRLKQYHTFITDKLRDISRDNTVIVDFYPREGSATIMWMETMRTLKIMGFDCIIIPDNTVFIAVSDLNTYYCVIRTEFYDHS